LFGGFDPHHHRHEIAVQVLKEQQWYLEALASPDDMWAAFPSLRMWVRGAAGATPEIKDYCEKIMKELLGKGLEVQKEYAQGWLQSVHLLGPICNEQHRQLVARLVLTTFGREAELAAALEGKGKLPPIPPLPIPASVTLLRVGKVIVTPEGYVAKELDRRLRLNLRGGAFQKFQLGNSPAKLKEWLHLAVAPPCEAGSFAFTAEACPLLYTTYISMLFVGFSDNTVLEQYVSQYRIIQDLRMDSMVKLLGGGGGGSVCGWCRCWRTSLKKPQD
jgi:hypothetical protein